MKKSSKEPEFKFSEEHVKSKSPKAKFFLEQRSEQGEIVDAANNKLLKRIYNVDHNVYLEGGALPAVTKELMGLVASASLRCDDCIFYHCIQAYRLGSAREELEESLNIATVVAGTVVVPHLRRAYGLIHELYAAH